MDYTKEEVFEALDEIHLAQIQERQVHNSYYGIISELRDYLSDNKDTFTDFEMCESPRPIIEALSAALDSIRDGEPIVDSEVCDCSGLDELMDWDKGDWKKA